MKAVGKTAAVAIVMALVFLCGIIVALGFFRDWPWTRRAATEAIEVESTPSQIRIKPTGTAIPGIDLADVDYLVCWDANVVQSREFATDSMRMASDAMERLDVDDILFWLDGWEEEAQFWRANMLYCPMPTHEFLRQARSDELAAIEEMSVAVELSKEAWRSLDFSEADRIATHLERATGLLESALDAVTRYNAMFHVLN